MRCERIFCFFKNRGNVSVLLIRASRESFIKAKYKPGKYYIKEQKDLAFELLNGGYILFFRHAEREKWIDVKKYDSIETNEGLKAENEYFKNAVCLSERGLESWSY